MTDAETDAETGPSGRPAAPAASARPGVAATDPPARVILDSQGIERCVTRIAHEIVERNAEIETLVLVAIAAGGLPVGEMLAERTRAITETAIPLGTLDVTLYRDDVIGRGKRPVPQRTRMPFSVAGRRVVLIDDVVFTGRTIRAAMDAVIDFGRPQGIQVATLIDRGHRELPIQVDFVGKNIPTARTENVVLRQGVGGEYEVVLV